MVGRKKMNKTEFINILAKRAEISKSKCEKVLSEMQNTITEVLKKGDEVSIRNFGKFQVVERKERKCVNPVTKRFYMSKPKKITVFKGYKNFKYCLK